MLRTRLTLKPGAAGTKKLFAKYGSRLVAVRYRYDEERQTRCKTIEIIIEEIPWTPTDDAASRRAPAYNPDDLVDVYLAPAERALHQAIHRRDGTYNDHDQTWTLRYADALSLRITHRILPPPTPTALPNTNPIHRK
jgi:hypothetical protein